MANYIKALFSIKLDLGGLKYNLLAGETPCNLGSETDPKELKKYNFLKDSPVKPEFKYNENKGIGWNIFKLYSNEFLYEPTCENFKEMPDEIWNTIFKKVYWNGINGDEIKNQGIANMLSYIALKSGGIMYLSINLPNILKSFGYELKPKQNVNILNVDLSKLDSEFTYIINEIDAKGKSSELYNKLFFDYEKNIIPLEERKENDILINPFYILNKPYASSITEKLLFLGGILGIVGGLIIFSKTS
jgi:hypothetical protein